jgi:GT2 family glycosyltransferase
MPGDKMSANMIGPSAAPPTATVIIVAYESGAFLQPCVDALAAQTYQDFEAVIVDNASSDGSVRDLRLPDDRFEVLSLELNTGFAVANNLAAAASAAEFLVLLNPDAVAEPTWLETLVAAAHQAPDIASVGSLQRRLDNPEVLDGVGDVWHVAGLAWRAGEGQPAAGAPGDGEIFGPCGAAALYRRAAFQALGGFDERFFCYCEDVDLAFRLRAAGYRSVRASRAVVRHAGSGISGRRSDFTLYHGHRNRIWTFVKNTPGVWFWLLLPYHLAFNTIYLGSALKRGVLPPVWRAYVAAGKGLPSIWRSRPPPSSTGARFPEMMKSMAWTPWSPFRRELHPRSKP